MKPLQSSVMVSHKHCTLWPIFCVTQVLPVDKIVSLLKLYEVMLMNKTKLPHVAIAGM